jgi:hypothetical protein
LEERMKDAYEVLQQKEADLARVRKEIDSLNIVARLLSKEGICDNAIPKSGEATPSSLSETISRLSDSASTNVDRLFSSIEGSRSGFWDSLKRAR